MPTTPEDLLIAWFGSANPEEFPLAGRASWWVSDPEQDEALRATFGATLAAARAGELDHWVASPTGLLAMVILLDQLSRNIFRGTARAFAGDPDALALARQAIALGWDQELPPPARLMLYMPFQHCEELECQDAAISLFGQLAEELATTEYAAAYRRFLDFVHQHRRTIQRFGRFPHRNAALEREPTPEELAWLAEGGPDFGQSSR